ncbi:MAG: DUF402 domain-containing protein [Erysipelotrichaceae bacterium]|nr:DUF402 domain-containing protein [Erysipelotrichaceae bacterium]
MLDKRSWKRATWTMITEKELSWFMLEDCFCGVIHMKQVSEPFSVGNPALVICNQGITWVQCAWRNSNIWATAMFDASGKLFQIYFDIADEVFIDGENTWFTDLIVDVVYQPGGTVRVLDLDELEEAVQKQMITFKQKQQAEALAERLKSALEKNFEDVEAWFEQVYEKVQKKL